MTTTIPAQDNSAGSPALQHRARRRPLLLDLFCCAGGAATGYHRAGFDVVGVDIVAQPNYPFEFHRADALEFVAEHGSRFDAIHASPPCQGYLNLGAVNRALEREYNHPDLIAATRELLGRTGLPYVIENVQDARKQLVAPVRICGTGLNQPLRRHRLFESNVPLIGIPCAHDRFTEPKYWTSWRPGGERKLSTVVQVYGNAGGRQHWAEAMGMDWATDKEMAEAVPPSYTHHLGRQLLATVHPKACNETRCQAPGCRTPITQPGTGRPRQFCSGACRVRAHRRRAAETLTVH